MSRFIASVYALVVIAVLSLTPPVRADLVDVYILAGQSNAGGHGYVSREFAYFSQFKDPGLVEIGETKWLAEQPGATLFAWGGTVPTKERPYFWERRTRGWVPMKAGFDALGADGKIVRNNPFGVEVTFASRMAELRPGRKIAIVKFTRGATSVRTDWDPVAGRAYDVAAPKVAGHCYAGLMQAYKEAMDAIRKDGDEPTLRGLLWLQGESDAGVPAEEYVRRLSILFGSLREDLSSPRLPIAVGELLQINPQFESLRAAQKRYAESDSHAVLAPADGLTADHTFGGKLHIDTASLLAFGTRFADLLAPMIESQPPTTAQAEAPKPILDGFTADPAIRVFGNTYYVYPTSDKPNWMTTDFSVWSSKNLIDWKREGMILDVTKDLAWAKIRAWAPDCIERDGKYYFYFCADTKIGVGVADRPTGPFKDALGRPLIQVGGKVTVAQAIDPAAFIDDDGQAYLYFGNGAHAQVFKLKRDMITLDGDPTDIKLKEFREGVVVFKRNGKYYFMWSIDDARSPDYRVGWGTSDSPLGPVKAAEKDFIALKKNGLAVGTAHHSVLNVPGTDRWYVAYHRHAIPGGSGYQREVCLVRMEFDEAGNIKPMDPLASPFKPGDIGEPLKNSRGRASLEAAN